MVSTPDAGSDAAPEETWTADPQHFVFWNLNYAGLAQFPAAPPKPPKLFTGFALGVADTLINGLLSPLNDANAEVSAMLNAANFSGRCAITPPASDIFAGPKTRGVTRLLLSRDLRHGRAHFLPLAGTRLLAGAAFWDRANHRPIDPRHHQGRPFFGRMRTHSR